MKSRWLDPDPTEVPEGDSDTVEALQMDVDSYNNEYGPYTSNAVSWYSWNTSIATVSGGVISGLLARSTNITATVEFPLYWFDNHTMDCLEDGTGQTDVSGQVQVDPNVYISSIGASPQTLASRTSATSTITVQVAASQGVPATTKVDVQLLLESKSLSELQLQPTLNQSGGVSNQNSGVAVRPDQPGSCTFTVGTTNTNPVAGSATYRAFITAVNDTGSTTVRVVASATDKVTIMVP